MLTYSIARDGTASRGSSPLTRDSFLNDGTALGWALIAFGWVTIKGSLDNGKEGKESAGETDCHCYVAN